MQNDTEEPRQFETGKVVAIWVKRMKRGPMDPRPSVRLIEGAGIEGNANQGGRRQVTIIEAERWAEMMEELKADLPPSTRRANLLVKGIRLAESRDRVLAIGDCRLRVLGETRPCERMEEALAGLRSAMQPDWRGGVYGEVLAGGIVSLGDPVRWMPRG